MKKRFPRFLSFLMAACMLAGCTAAPEVPQPSSSATSQPAISAGLPPEPQSRPQPELEPQPQPETLPRQVQDYLRGALQGSRLLTIGPDGQVLQNRFFPDKAYSAGAVFGDGRYLFCQQDAGSAGEASWADNVVVDLQTKEVFLCDETQWGYQRHLLLDENIIGFAMGGRVLDSQDKQWTPLKFYDKQYRPLNLQLDFDFGRTLKSGTGDASPYSEHFVTGICYDKNLRRYYLTFAKDLTHLPGGSPWDLYSENQMGIAVFDEVGQLVEAKLLPSEYTAPYSHNVFTLISNNPQLTEDGWLILNHDTAARETGTLLVDPFTWEAIPLPYERLRYVGDGLFWATQRNEREPRSQLVKIHNGGVKEHCPLPGEIAVEGYTNGFTPTQMILNNGTGYITAISWVNQSVYFSGLFYWDGRKPELVHLLTEYFNLAGMDGQGNCLLLLDGIPEEYREEYKENLQRHYGIN